MKNSINLYNHLVAILKCPLMPAGPDTLFVLATNLNSAIASFKFTRPENEEQTLNN